MWTRDASTWHRQAARRGAEGEVPSAMSQAERVVWMMAPTFPTDDLKQKHRIKTKRKMPKRNSKTQLGT